MTYESIDWSECDLVDIIDSGEPVLKGIRQTVLPLVEHLDNGYTVDDVSYEYGIDLSVVIALKEFVDEARK